MFDKIFAQKKLKKQATLRMLREEIKLELENAKDDYDRSIIKPIYNSLEEYTDGSCDMLAYPSTVRLDNRMIGFGLKNVPPDNWLLPHLESMAASVRWQFIISLLP